MVATVLLLLACSGSDQMANPAVKADSFAIRFGETVQVPGTEWTATFQSVTQDSRCPMSVQCVWAGIGQVIIKLHRAGSEDSLMLETDPPKNEAVVQGVRFQLKRLDPYPAGPGSRPAEEYSVTLEVAAE